MHSSLESCPSYCLPSLQQKGWTRRKGGRMGLIDGKRVEEEEGRKRDKKVREEEGRERREER